MSTSNWPGGVDRSSANWNLRTPRNLTGGAWAPDSDKPRCGWLAVALVTAVACALFYVVVALGTAVGFAGGVL